MFPGLAQPMGGLLKHKGLILIPRYVGTHDRIVLVTRVESSSTFAKMRRRSGHQLSKKASGYG